MAREAGGDFDLIISNIYAEVLTTLVEEVSHALRLGGRWITSGILAGAAEDALQKKATFFLELTDRKTILQERLKLDSSRGLHSQEEEWVHLEFVKKK